MPRYAVIVGISLGLLAAAGAGLAPSLGAQSIVLAADSASDTQLSRDVHRQLSSKNFHAITVFTENGTVTLSGQVDLYADKANAVNKAQKVSGVRAVRDNIAVGGPAIPDDVLQRTLLSKIQVDRIGYGQVFNAISVHVQNGAVTLGGHALGPMAAQSAVSLTARQPGVKAIVDQIRVDPTSPIDDRIRRSVFRAIYGFPALRRYTIVPSHPIRISVQNSRVTLYGIVDNAMDKQLAYTRARTVPGVLQVSDELIIAAPQNK